MEQNDRNGKGSAPPEQGGGGFPKTSWTLLGQASKGRAAGNSAAINEFTERYYTAVHAYIAAIVRNAATAEELTQQFFVTAVLSGRLLLRADRAKGSFRPYLKQSIRNFLVDEHRRLARKKEESAESAVHPDGFRQGWEGLGGRGGARARYRPTESVGPEHRENGDRESRSDLRGQRSSGAFPAVQPSISLWIGRTAQLERRGRCIRSR